MGVVPTATSPVYAFDDERLSNCFIHPAKDENGNDYFLFICDYQEQNWTFRLTEDGVFYLNGLGHLIVLNKVKAIGFKDNQEFGSVRRYIFSRTLPMMNDTIVLGNEKETMICFMSANI